MVLTAVAVLLIASVQVKVRAATYLIKRQSNGLRGSDRFVSSSLSWD
jgi:hypothetical protein